MKKLLASLIFFSVFFAPNLQAAEDWYVKYQTERLQYRAEMMRGERHFYLIKIRNGLCMAVLPFIAAVAFEVWALKGATNITLDQKADKMWEYLKLDTHAVDAFVLLNLVHQDHQRRSFNKNMNALLQKYIDPNCDFKSLPIEQAMLLMAAHEKKLELVRMMFAQNSDFLKERGVLPMLAELYCGDGSIESASD